MRMGLLVLGFEEQKQWQVFLKSVDLGSDKTGFRLSFQVKALGLCVCLKANASSIKTIKIQNRATNLIITYNTIKWKIKTSHH